MTEHVIAQARTADLPEVARLVNSAYRGEAARQGWTHEADLLDGQRTDPVFLAEQLAGPDPSVVLCLREADTGPILACVFLELVRGDTDAARCDLGMLTVSPALQARGLGRILLTGAEDFARIWGAAALMITVISARQELIAWYERRGFRRTGETEPFPYEDERFGLPKSDDLQFLLLSKTL